MTETDTDGFLARLERVALVGTRALSVLGLVALMIPAFITLANGLLRWLINQPIALVVVDVGALAIAIAVSCCIPIAMMERSNITFRLVSSANPTMGRIFDVVARYSGRDRACADGVAVLGLCRRTDGHRASELTCSRYPRRRSGMFAMRSSGSQRPFNASSSFSTLITCSARHRRRGARSIDAV